MRICEFAQPSNAWQQVHQQLIDRAKLALTGTRSEQREFINVSLAIDHSQLGTIKNNMQEFVREFAERYSQPTAKQAALYSLNMQFFPLSLTDKVSTSRLEKVRSNEKV